MLVTSFIVDDGGIGRSACTPQPALFGPATGSTTAARASAGTWAWARACATAVGSGLSRSGRRCIARGPWGGAGRAAWASSTATADQQPAAAISRAPDRRRAGQGGVRRGVNGGQSRWAVNARGGEHSGGEGGAVNARALNAAAVRAGAVNAGAVVARGDEGKGRCRPGQRKRGLATVGGQGRGAVKARQTAALDFDSAASSSTSNIGRWPTPPSRYAAPQRPPGPHHRPPRSSRCPPP